MQTVVSLLNLGGRKAGLAPGTEDERDLEQVRLAIEGARALLPLVEPQLGPDAGAAARGASPAAAGLRAAGRRRGAEPGGEPGGPQGDARRARAAPPSPGGEGPGPAQSSGRLWVPGQ